MCSEHFADKLLQFWQGMEAEGGGRASGIDYKRGVQTSAQGPIAVRQLIVGGPKLVSKNTYIVARNRYIVACQFLFLFKQAAFVFVPHACQ